MKTSLTALFLLVSTACGAAGTTFDVPAPPADAAADSSDAGDAQSCSAPARTGGPCCPGESTGCSDQPVNCVDGTWMPTYGDHSVCNYYCDFTFEGGGVEGLQCGAVNDYWSWTAPDGTQRPCWDIPPNGATCEIYGRTGRVTF